jgi:trans-2,3-dihydro-3-hydroxyanthranilate isomerase
MPYQFHTADVFTDFPFGGNQLAVLPDARGLGDDQMLAIAREFNYSETVFVLSPETSRGTRKLRIYTSGGELPFAGHPTVGTAFVLAATGEIPLDGDETRIVLEEGVGPVPVLIKSRSGTPYFTQLSAAKVPERGPAPPDTAVLAEILSLDEADIYNDERLMPEAVSAGVPFLFVPLRSLDALGKARVRQDVWERKLKGSWASEIYLFVEEAESAKRGGVIKGDGVIRSRMYAPTLGIMEDPATGSAAAAFGGYLAWRSAKHDGMLKFLIHQGVEMGRPSRLEVEVDVTGGTVKGVRVGGATVLVSSGTLNYP